MKSAKEKILDLLKYKNEVVLKLTDIKLYSSDDLKEIEHWTEDVCRMIVKKMLQLIKGQNRFDSWPMHMSPPTYCPWCIKYPCEQCTYGKRNGQCNEDDCQEESTYQKFIRILTKKDTNCRGVFNPIKILEILES